MQEEYNLHLNQYISAHACRVHVTSHQTHKRNEKGDKHHLPAMLCVSFVVAPFVHFLIRPKVSFV